MPTAPDPRSDDPLEPIAQRLRALKAELGSAFWTDPGVRALQDELRRALGRAADGEDSGMSRRARDVARREAAYAPLLWAGRGDD